MKRLIAAIALLPTIAFAEESAWGPFTNQPVDGIMWEFKKNSLDVIKDENRIYWTYLFRTYKKGESKYDFVKIAVPVNGCANKNGTMYLLDLNNEKQGEVPFVFDGGTLGSNMAQQICKQGDLVLEKIKQQENEPKPTSA
jgi:hypothetical protein